MDELARYNKARWEDLANARVGFSRPWTGLDRNSARQRLDVQGLLGDVTGKNVLCLASGGGQQSIAFALLGAQVTVLDLSDGQLARDREAAALYGLDVRTVQGDMRDLSVLRSEEFDIVWQVYSINNVPDCRAVIVGVRRVLKPGGFYRLDLANPVSAGTDEKSWNGTGYVLKLPFVDGAEVTGDGSEWEVWDDAGNCRIVPGPKEYRHSLGTVIDSAVDCGFRLLKAWEGPAGDPNAKPGSWDHYCSIVPCLLSLWMQLDKTGR